MKYPKGYLAILVMLFATACGKPADKGDVINQNLMIALGQAKNYHHKAKLLMSDGKTDEAIAAVRSILSLSFPKNAPEADDVRDDARAMLGKLLAGKGQLDAAMQVVDEGLAQSRRDSFFIANLHTVRGELLEQRALNDEADTSAPDGKAHAAQHRHDAIEEYDRSIKIEVALQKQLLENLVKSAIAGLVGGMMLAGAFVACHGETTPRATPTEADEILSLWTQIRQWRHEAHMDLDPTPNDLLGAAPKSVDDVKRVCPVNQPEPKVCDDVCGLADAICDNAEAICNLADKLGKQNAWAQDKCTSGKASCRESKQKCCGCSLPKDDR